MHDRSRYASIRAGLNGTLPDGDGHAGPRLEDSVSGTPEHDSAEQMPWHDEPEDERWPKSVRLLILIFVSVMLWWVALSL